MESHADKIAKRFNTDPDKPEICLREFHAYAKALEFALECIGKVQKSCLSTPPINCGQNGCPEGGVPLVVPLDTNHFFHEYGPENPCGKANCSVCYPEMKS